MRFGNIFCCFLVAVFASNVHGLNFFDDFEDNDISDWEARCAPGIWSVSDGKVHGSTTTNPTELTPINALPLQNGEITISVSGIHAFGICARLDSDDSGIIAYVSPDYDVARIRVVENGVQSTILASLNYDFPSGVVYELTLFCSDQALSLYITVPSSGEEWIFAAIDPNPHSGKYGFHMGEEPGASWDWISVESPTSSEGESEAEVYQQPALNISLNPFFSSVTFTYLLPGYENSSLDIFDLAGRCITSIDINSGDTAQTLNWNGRASDGGVIPAGVYVAKLRGYDQTTVRLIKI